MTVVAKCEQRNTGMSPKEKDVPISAHAKRTVSKVHGNPLSLAWVLVAHIVVFHMPPKDIVMLSIKGTADTAGEEEDDGGCWNFTLMPLVTMAISSSRLRACLKEALYSSSPVSGTMTSTITSVGVMSTLR